MKTFLCLLLVIFSLISYVGVTPKLGIYMYHPIPHYLGMLVGIGLLVRLMQKKFTKRRLAATIFSVFVVCFFFWYTTIFSDIENTKANISTGKVASRSLKQINLVKIDGKKLPLEKVFKKNKGTVVVFSRGAWWPFCVQQLVELQEFYSEFSAMNIEIYAVLPNLKSAVAMKEESAVDYYVVYDDNLMMAKNMGLLHEGAIPIKDIDLAQPATFLFDSNGKVIWSYVSTNYRIRPDSMDILVAAKEHFKD